MMIEDEELRGIYQTSSEERLQTLDAGLLHLEKHPEDGTTLEGLLREAHSLKGDSTMLGLSEISQVAHHLEHILGRLQRGELWLNAEWGDRLAQGLAALREMVQTAVTGIPCGVTAATAIAAMEGTASLLCFGKADSSTEPSAAIQGTGTSDQAPPGSPITDATQREDFAVASATHLASLEAGVQQWGEAPGDEALWVAMYQAAAALQADSTQLGLTDIATLTQQMVQLLGALQRGEEPVSAVLGDRLTHGLEALQGLCQAAITGIPSQVNVCYVLAELMGAPPRTDLATSRQVLPPAPTGAPIKSTNGNGATPAIAAEPAQPSTYRIETIRVPTHTLDTLMTQTGELTVTKIRVNHRLGEIEAIANLWEEWSRDLLMHRYLSHTGPQGQQVRAQWEGLHSRTEQSLEQLGILVNRLQSALAEDATRLDMISTDLEASIRTLRLLPLSTIFHLFPRLVRDLARQEGKAVELVIEGAETQADKRILEEMKDPLLHMIRNAIDHGIEPPAERRQLGKPEVATITLRGYQTPTSIVLEVSDDGRGLNLDAIQQTALRRGLCRPEELDTMTPEQIQTLILSPGFSTRTMVTEISGRGVGLDVLRTNVERLKGNIEVNSIPGQGCTIRVHLGTTLATAHVLIVSVHQNTYALPVEFVQTACLVRPEDIFTLEGRQAIRQQGQPVAVVWLADLLELPRVESAVAPGETQKPLSCIILRVGSERLGVVVDMLIDEQDVVLKPQSQLLKRVRNVAGATILGTGEVCMVLHPPDLIQTVRRRGVGTRSTATIAIAPAPPRPLSILLVEDSIATRTQEKRILESAGYTVVTAVDGVDGFNKLQSRPFDAVVTDVQMPNLDGLALTERIRQHREYSELPVVLVTTLASDEDRQRGAAAGANAYITKGSFNQEVLLETLQRLI